MPLDLDLAHEDGGYAGWTVIAGPNGAGKTTLLQAIALCLAGRDRAAELGLASERWVSAGARSGRAELVLQAGVNDTFFPLFDQTSDRPFALGCAFDLDNRAGDPWFSDQWVDGTGRTCTATDGPWMTAAKTTIGWFAAAYGAGRRVANGRADELTRDYALASIARPGHALQHAQAWIIDLHTRSLEEQVRRKSGGSNTERLAGILDLLNGGLLPPGVKIERVSADGLHVSDADGERVLREMSDGYQVAVTMVVDLLHHIDRAFGRVVIYRDAEGRPVVNNEGVVLIDEAELHLHPSWQRRLGGWLVSAFPKIQFLCTTHSAFICQSAAPGGLIRLPAPGSGEAARKLTTEEQAAVLHGSADDAYLSSLFGLDTSRSPEADALRARLNELESKLLRKSATPAEVAEYTAVRAQIPESQEVLRVLSRFAP